MVDIIEVYKTKVLKDSARLARPSGWETSLGVQVVLEDPCGAQVQTRINFFCFIMNPEWRKLSVVKHVEKWLPENLDYRGPVLKPPAPPSPIPTAPPSPRSPALVALLEGAFRESTVTKSWRGSMQKRARQSRRTPKRLLNIYARPRRSGVA